MQQPDMESSVSTEESRIVFVFHRKLLQGMAASCITFRCRQPTTAPWHSQPAPPGSSLPCRHHHAAAARTELCARAAAAGMCRAAVTAAARAAGWQQRRRRRRRRQWGRPSPAGAPLTEWKTLNPTRDRIEGTGSGRNCGQRNFSSGPARRLRVSAHGAERFRMCARCIDRRAQLSCPEPVQHGRSAPGAVCAAVQLASCSSRPLTSDNSLLQRPPPAACTLSHCRRCRRHRRCWTPDLMAPLPFVWTMQVTNAMHALDQLAGHGGSVKRSDAGWDRGFGTAAR